MNKLNAKSIMIVSMSFVLAACGSASAGAGKFNIPKNDRTTAYGLAGKVAREQYNGLLATSIGSLNYLTTQESNNAQHFANFVDGLLTHNEYGVLEKNLAERVTHNDDYTEFEFTVRQGVKWQRYDGTQYEATIEGEKVPQFVQPSDFANTALTICDMNSKSDLNYLITTFVKGAEEYYRYTEIITNINADKPTGVYRDMKETDYDKIAKQLNTLIKTNSPAIWHNEYDDGNKQIEATDVPNIANKSRFGVQADDEKHTVTYTLNQKAPYFPTLFTYSCYLPTNKYFIKEVKLSSFGTEKDKILYNGPYLLDTWSESKVTYRNNPDYWNVENTVTVNKIVYQVITDTNKITDAYTRQEFEGGRIDGFSLNQKDGEGWKKYVTNGEPDKYNYRNPYDARVNARLLDTIGNMYGSNIVMDRANTNTTTSYATGGNKTTVQNTSRAFSIDVVRKAVLDGIDEDLLFALRYTNLDEELRQQEKVWTYVPKGFVIDDNGDDYLTHYYDVYAEKKGLTGGAGDADNPVAGTAAYELRPGQTGSKNVAQEDLNKTLDLVKTAVNLYNSTNSTKITLPIQLEMYSLQFDDDSKEIDDQIVESMNKRLNYGSATDRSLFKVIPTDKLSQSNYESVSRGGTWDFSTIQWGWGADYGDPLTFMNTYVKGGDWGDIFPYIDQEKVDNYVLNANGTALTKKDLLAEYTEIVAKGAGETEDFNKRFDYFAEAEYMLLEELNIYRPQTNNGQGWSLSVSRSAGYFMPTSSYGLSGDRLTGWYILDEVMTRDERAKAREKQDELKAKYVTEHGSINIY